MQSGDAEDVSALITQLGYSGSYSETKTSLVFEKRREKRRSK